MLTLNEYYAPIDKALAEWNVIYSKFISKIQYWDEDDIILHSFDFNQRIKEIEDILAQLKIKRVRYKFDKMNEEEFEKILRRDSHGNLTIEKDYQIKQHDTLRSIALEFNLDENFILNHNGLNKQDFWDKRELNGIIKIPVYIRQKERTVYENLAVFDSHSGKSAWGKDITNALQTEAGRLKVLDYLETLKQSLRNMLDHYIPFYEAFAFDSDWGSDYDKEFLEMFSIVKLKKRLEAEPRVQEVLDIESKKGESSITLSVKLYPINVEPKQGNELDLIAA